MVMVVGVDLRWRAGSAPMSPLAPLSLVRFASADWNPARTLVPNLQGDYWMANQVGKWVWLTMILDVHSLQTVTAFAAYWLWKVPTSRSTQPLY